MSFGLDRKETLPFSTNVPKLDIAKLADLVTLNVPDGYQTIPGWWATKEPEALRLLRDPLLTFMEEADKLEAVCTQEGADYAWVDAPLAFRKIGLDTVMAFPSELLEQVYPQHP